MTGAQQRVAPIFPDGYERAPRLRPIYRSDVPDVKLGREYRRRISRDPLLFSLLYLTPYLRDETTGAISFSTMHLHIYDRFMRWLNGGPDRSAWASHRDAGKTVKGFLEAPLYGAAHCGLDFCLMLSNTGDQVKPHLATLKAALEGDSLLVHDFPELRPARPWTVTDARTKGGCRFLAAGMEKNILGSRDREKRPKLIVGDDLEEGAEDWTAASKAKNLGRLQNDVLRTGSRNTVVMLFGTPVAVGAMAHDWVRVARGREGALPDRAAWVRGEGFDPHWYPALVDAGTARERSAWETHWPTAKLLADREAAPREFALQMQCDPDDPAATKWWRDGPYPQGTFRYNPDFGGFGLYRILSGDPAVTDKKTSDESAIAVLSVTGSTPASMRVCVDRAISGHWSPDEFWRRYRALHQEFADTVKVWLVDTGNGGDYIVRGVTPPPGVALQPYRTDEDSKSYRAEALYDDYAAGLVFHRGEHVALEAEQVAWRWGQSKSPNLIDAVGAAERRALYGDPSKAPARRSA